MRYTISLTCATLAAAGAASAEAPLVVADIAPVHALVAQVMGDLGSPVLLTERGSDAHSFQLRPSQAAAVAEADLVVWVGPEMTPWLDRVLDSLSGDGAQLVLLEAPGTATRPMGAGDGHDEDAEAGHADADGHEAHGDAHAEAADAHAEHGEAHAEAADAHGAQGDMHAEDADGHGHAAGSADPHAWLDPGNAAVWLRAIADELARIDSANAATYRANAETAAAGVAALDATLVDQLAPLRDRPFAVFHDAYGYFTDHYGLTVTGTVAMGDAAAPGAARLKDLQAGLAAGEALCIFPEANHDPKQVMTLAEGTGVRIGGALDPEGALVDPGPGAYAATLTGLADTLADCLAAAG
jgi:zinc transport system substrate-binding protein